MRTLAIALMLSLPLVAGAQAFRCKDPTTGSVVYTDQPCKGGEMVVPARTDADRLADEQAAEQARARAVDRQQQARYEQIQRQEVARQEAANRAALPPSQTPQCQNAMAEADFRARSTTATQEQIRTARYNAALACGQQPPADVVVVPQEPWAQAPYGRRPPLGYPGGWGPGDQGHSPYPTEPQRPRPNYGGGTLDNRPIPVAPTPTTRVPTRPTTGSVGVSAPRSSGVARPDETSSGLPVR